MLWCSLGAHPSGKNTQAQVNAVTRAAHTLHQGHPHASPTGPLQACDLH